MLKIKAVLYKIINDNSMIKTFCNLLFIWDRSKHYKVYNNIAILYYFNNAV